MTALPRTYGQMCPIARALDVIGERWTLLIVRELLLGPKRFKDLLEELPAMGTNRLATRLKRLETDGVIAKATLPPPGEARVYVLTEAGERLRETVVSLGRWGAALPLHDRLDPSTGRAALLALIRCVTAPADRLRDVREIYDFDIAGERFHIIVADGAAIPCSGPAPANADASIHTDIPTLLQIDAGTLTLDAARRQHGATINGSAQAIRRVFAIMRRPN